MAREDGSDTAGVRRGACVPRRPRRRCCCASEQERRSSKHLWCSCLQTQTPQSLSAWVSTKLGLPQDCHRWTATLHGSQWSPAVRGPADGASSGETALQAAAGASLHDRASPGSSGAGFFSCGSQQTCRHEGGIGGGVRGPPNIAWVRRIVQKPRPTETTSTGSGGEAMRLNR